MKFLHKLAIISVVLFVIGLASSNHHKSKSRSRVPVYEVPSIKKNNSVCIKIIFDKIYYFYF